MTKLSREELEVRIAGKKDLTQIKIVDDLAFGVHHGISMAELKLLYQHGAIIFIAIKKTNKIIAHTQLLFEPISTLPYIFDSNIAYGYGRAVLSEFQRQGLSKLLAEQEEKIAKQQEKDELRITIRVENYKNLCARLKEGFIIFDYAPTFYGPVLKDARLLLMKKLNSPTTPENFVNNITVPVVFGDCPDPAAHRQIANLILHGFQGIQIVESGIIFAHIETKG